MRPTPPLVTAALTLALVVPATGAAQQQEQMTMRSTARTTTWWADASTAKALALTEAQVAELEALDERMYEATRERNERFSVAYEALIEALGAKELDAALVAERRRAVEGARSGSLEAERIAQVRSILTHEQWQKLSTSDPKALRPMSVSRAKMRTGMGGGPERE